MPETERTKTRRIAKNTVLLYMRSLISLFISLYTSRLVLKGLGVDDYGIYGVVGSFVSMFSIVTSSLNGAISRFLNFAKGKGDKDDVANTFSLSLTIMFILSVIVVLLTETFGLWFLYNRMTIPPDRLNAAFWCFQFSVLSSVSGFLVVSFTASIIANEKMGVFAYIDVGEVVLKFFIALLITFSVGNIDKLVLYAALLLTVTLGKQMISRIYAMKHFEECQLRWYWNTKKFWEMFTYAGWNFLGKTSGSFAGQGVNLIINVVFGPAVNAARALAWSVNHSVQNFVNNFTIAINPQITQSYASNDIDYFKSLLFHGAKLTFFSMYVIALPLMLETTFVVTLWLGEFPAHTINFIRLTLITNTVATLQVVLAMGIFATGKIMWYQLTFSFWEFCLFILAYILFHHGFVPEWSYICSLFLNCCKVITMLVLCKKQLSIPIRDYVRRVVVPLFAMASVAATLPTFIHFSMPMGWWRLLVTTAISIICTIVCFLFIACNKNERDLVISMVISKIRSKIN